MDQAKIGSFLKELRKEKNLTQEQLAEKYNVAARTVSRWENGNNLPDISLLIELADFYDVDIREILDGERKSENMDQEVKEALTRVADYTDAEKENILKKSLICIAGTVAVFLVLVIFNIFHINNEHGLIAYLYYLMPTAGLMLAGWGAIRILQIKGNMSKNRLSKVKKVIVPLCIVIGLITVFSSIALVTWFTSYKSESISAYNKKEILNSFKGDIDSNLSVFPENIEGDVTLFDVSLDQNVFDTDGYIILSCEYRKAQYEKEVGRLSKLKMTIKNSNESFVNKIRYDENSYSYPAYIAIDGFGNTYEYALINEDLYEITYLYLAYPNPENFKYPDYLMSDKSAYDEMNTLNSFSMYNHSFDGGNSYIEFDD